MALTIEDSNKVWQKVKIALANANPCTLMAFAGLKTFLAQQKGNAQLQFVPFTEAQCDAAGGTVIIDAAHTLYAIWIKKEDSGTDNWFWYYDDATNDTTDANARVCLPLLIALEEKFFIKPMGSAMATGGLVTQYATDPLGKSDGSNGGDGFVIIGAA